MSNYRDEFLENSYYLVSNKWFNDNILFSTADNYKTFILYVIEKLLEYPTILLSAYCLLPNYFYFVVKNVNKWFDLSNFMRKVQVSYAMYLKKNPDIVNLSRGVPIFEWRFKTRLLKEEEIENAENCVSYEPLRIGLVEKLKDWPYDSVHQLIDTWFDYTQQTHIKVYNEWRKISKKMFSDEDCLV